jgi:hypothetical protein
MISFGQQYLDRDVCVNFIKLYEWCYNRP